MNFIYKLIFLALLLFVGSIGVSFYLYSRTVQQLPNYGKVPEFQFSDSQDKAFGLTDLDGRVWVASFFFTSCPVICPEINGRVAALYRKQKGNEKVHFVSVTVDPERDTAAVLKEYAKKFGANENQWHFLTAKLQDIQKFSIDGLKLGIFGDPSLHTTRLVLVDSKGDIRGYYSGKEEQDLKKLTKDIDLLVRFGA